MADHTVGLTEDVKKDLSDEQIQGKFARIKPAVDKSC